jgi:hypothetical protein
LVNGVRWVERMTPRPGRGRGGRGAIYVPLAVVSGLYGAASGVLARVAAQGLQEILPGG